MYESQHLFRMKKWLEIAKKVATDIIMTNDILKLLIILLNYFFLQLSDV